MKDRMWGPPMALGHARVLRPGRLLWLRALAWLVFSVFAVALAFGLSGEALASLSAGRGDAAAFAARAAGAVLVLLAYGLLVRFGEARHADELALRPVLPQLLGGLALGGAMFALVMLLLAGAGLYEVRQIGLPAAWASAAPAIEAGIVEEVMVRGLIFRLMWRAFGPLAAFLVSAVAFGVGHLGNDNATLFAIVCIALEAGIMLGAFYALTGRLWVSIGVHIGWNFSQGYIFGAVVSGESLGPSAAVSTARGGYPDWLTGGPFGPEASLPSLLVCSTVGAAALWLAWRAGRFESPGRGLPSS